MYETMDWRDRADFDRWSKDFWDNPDDWPRDMLGMVFLARAVDEVGRSKLGDKWKSGLSPYSAEKSDRRVFAEAAETLATALAEGKVTYVLRGTHGGAYSKPGPAAQWISDDLLCYFYNCKMDAGSIERYSSAFGDRWIFVAREGLSQITSPRVLEPESMAQHAPEPPPRPLQSASPQEAATEWVRALIQKRSEDKQPVLKQNELITLVDQKFGLGAQFVKDLYKDRKIISDEMRKRGPRGPRKTRK